MVSLTILHILHLQIRMVGIFLPIQYIEEVGIFLRMRHIDYENIKVDSGKNKREVGQGRVLLPALPVLFFSPKEKPICKKKAGKMNTDMLGFCNHNYYGR